MQCINACSPLVEGYFSSANDFWIETPYNTQLKEFFNLYRISAAFIDPLPFVNQALKFSDQDFDGTVENDPSKIIENLFTALIASHAQVYKDLKQLDKNYAVEITDTFVGKFIASRIYTKIICNNCKHIEWIIKEEKIISLPEKLASDTFMQYNAKEGKYSFNLIEGNVCFVPSNIKIVRKPL